MVGLRVATGALIVGLAAACSGPSPEPPTTPRPTERPSPPATATATTSPVSTPASSASPSAAEPIPSTHTFSVVEHERFDEPWAMVALPGTRVLAVTEQGGALKLRDADGVREVTGVPEVVVTEQGGLGDIIAGPTFTTDGTVYLSWVEGSDGATGAVVGTAHLDVAAARLTDVRRIWRQTPEIDGGGHYSHRLAIHDDHLFVSSGDRQQFTPAQELDTDLGKILRLTLDGKPAPGNPFQDDGPPADGFWSIGHRNPLGLAFDADGRLWSSEMGPKGGDEINLIRPGANYGWPEASNGSNYDGSDIPDHRQGDGFTAPLLWWNPSVSPGSLMIYGGDLFPAWRGDAFVGALSGEALIRIHLDAGSASLGETWPMGTRIREVEQGAAGEIWLLSDGPEGRLLELSPS